MLVHLIQEIVDRHARDLPQRSRDNLVQEILMRIDENFVVVPHSHSLATHLTMDMEQSRITGKWA